MDTKRSRTIVLENITEQTTCRSLLDIFEKYGTVKSVKVETRPRDNKQTRLGFVGYEEHESAQAAMDELKDSLVFDEKKVTMTYAKKGLKRMNDAYGRAGFHRTKLHVSGLPEKITKEELEQLLGECTLYIPKEQTGYCFADYKNEDDKNNAVNKLNGKVLDEEHELKLVPAFLGKLRYDNRGGYGYNYRKKGDRREKVMD